jgi:hypothetical protein
MSKFEVVCPHCRKPNAVEKTSFGAPGTDHGQQDIKCPHCSKRWKENVGETSSLAKSAPSGELSALIVQVRGQFGELMTKINALAANRTAAAARQSAKFVTKGAESDVEWNDTAKQELEKALNNGTRIDVAKTEVSTSSRFQTVESIGVGVRTAPGGRFVPDGFENNDVAKAELNKALSNGKRVDC